MEVRFEPPKLLKLIDENAFKLLQDETRRGIMFLLRDNEFTAKELSTRLNMTPQNVYHHIRKLQDAGLIMVTEERRSGHLIESYYTVTADTFIYNADEMVEKSLQSFIDILNGLNEMGIAVEVTEENANRLSELHKRQSGLLNIPPTTYDICSTCSFSGYFMKFGPMNPILLNRILHYTSLMNMNDEEFEKSLELTRKLRQFLLSITTQNHD